jgi:hypothetical protein
VLSDEPERDRVSLLKRPMGFGTVGSFLAYLLAVIVGIAILVIFGRLGVFDPHRGLSPVVPPGESGPLAPA